MYGFFAIALYAFLPFGDLPVGDINAAVRSDLEHGTVSAIELDFSHQALWAGPRIEMEQMSAERKDAKVRYPAFTDSSWLLFVFTSLGACTVRDCVDSLSQVVSWIVIALLFPLIVHSWKCSDS